MRTTLIVDDDVMYLARDLAKAERKPVSAVISELAREGYQARRAAAAEGGGPRGREFGRLPDRGVVVTGEQVNALREQLGV
ncbi:MAG: hypothetical protein LBS56_05685 [Propionibacteriaceae bacterium]|jgi:hypothetical protein|nr:hypothetical protein [Propionibacteriaceae bacterium]